MLSRSDVVEAHVTISDRARRNGYYVQLARNYVLEVAQKASEKRDDFSGSGVNLAFHSLYEMGIIRG